MIICPDEINSNTKFCHYTSMENARKILSSNMFYFSRLDKMNDVMEKELHEDELKKVFVLCFCHSEALSIPMFYMYSGIDGKGCRIQFTDTKIRDIISHGEVFPVNKRFMKLKQSYNLDAYDIYAGWVNYSSQNNVCCFHKDKPVERFPDFITAFEEMKRQNRQYLVKNPIWKYEKEFRIVIKFHEEIEYEHIALVFPVKESDKGISLYCGPENREKEWKEISEEFKGYGVSNTYYYETARINMGLKERYK